MSATIRTGDTVYHRPTKETWVVAYADYDRDELAWIGWPPGHAKLSDCTLCMSCSDEDHLKELTALSQMQGRGRDVWDYRKSYAIRALKALGEDLARV